MYINRDVVCICMPLLHAYFYEPPADKDDSWLNRLVSTWDAPYAHCDIQFQDGMASSVFRGETMYWKKRRFSKPGYSRITLSVGQADYDRAYSQCEHRHNINMAFDAVGMFALPLAGIFGGVDRERHTFCSKHCTEVLQVAGVKAVADLNPRATSPSALRRVLQNSFVYHTDRVDLRL